MYRNRNRSAPFLLEVDRDLSGRGIRCFATARRCAEVPLCQHLIGYLDAEGRGIAGLEKALDSQLAGTKEHDTLVCAVTAQGRLRAGETPQLTRQDSSAVGVQLTISRPVQRAAEAVAADTMTSGCILVLDTATAAVRASVSVPGYDPDDLAASLDAPDSPFLNRALESYAVVQCSSRCWLRQRWSRASCRSTNVPVLWWWMDRSSAAQAVFRTERWT